MPLPPLALSLVSGSASSVAVFPTPSEKSWVNKMCESLPGPGLLYRRAWKEVMNEARLIKTQRQKLGFSLRIRKAKQPTTGSYLSPGSQNETVSESCFLLSCILL